ncbi:hypothetical protein L21SP5_01394 [Salinivirga cyanobacteriivorans]|uniref:Gliding motility-associated protein GldM N-terminal domain-containing protein n=1 Tax=Salinivirga cyanobacteriivorans TaxID=1307839 RepID=A0A0S2HYG8_9BACT|nr:hypothetical protein [Salinivirga cyanobacteriivorans]ALO15044.1 hypothetical protein L21SP5_01394 [Salinivirga cyanobacteriivorans]
MKKTTQLIGILSIIFVGAGSLAKALHWPGAGFALVAGLVMLALFFVPLALINNYKAVKPPTVVFHSVVMLTVLIHFIAVLFKVMGWQGTEILMLIAFPFPFVVLIPTLLWYSKKYKLITLQQTIIVLFFMAYLGISNAFLVIDFSKELIDENISLEKEFQAHKEFIESINQLQNTNVDEKETQRFELAKQSIRQIKSQLLNTDDKRFMSQSAGAGFENLTNKTSFSASYSRLISAEKYVTELKENIMACYLAALPQESQQFLSEGDRSKVSDYVYKMLYLNPKLWTLTNLTFMTSQLELQKYVFLKHRSIKPPE